MNKKSDNQFFYCPNHNKRLLRPSYAYPSMLWCDLCTNAWHPHELNIRKNKQFLIKNITDKVRNPDYLFLVLEFSEKDSEVLTQIKKEREELISKYSKNIKNLNFNLEPFLNVHCLKSIKLKNEKKEQEEDLVNKMKNISLLTLSSIELDLKKCRSDSVLSTRCKMNINSSGISFENDQESDYEHIESAIILWKDLGIS